MADPRLKGDKPEGVCRYNENILCQERSCGQCGWDPIVSEKRLAAFRKRWGLEKKPKTLRLINAVEATARIRTAVMPMLEAGKGPWLVLTAVMQCLKETTTVESPVVECRVCIHSKGPGKETGQGKITCNNSKSPCNRRRVKGEDYCPYGERSPYEKH